MSRTYNKEYFENYGGIGYGDRETWKKQFARIADRIIADFNPGTVLDVGCAYGYLVEVFRERGVAAYGIDISRHALDQASPGIRDHVHQASITEALPPELPEEFDLVIAIEVLEHLYEEEGLAAIERICQLSGKIIVSTTSTAINDLTHLNVQQAEYWVKQFARHGFYNQVDYMGDYISKDTYCFRREKDIPRVIEDYERVLRQQRFHYELKNIQLEERIAGLEENILKCGSRSCEDGNPRPAEGMAHQRENLENQLRVERREKEVYQALYHAIQDSRMWRMTRLIRRLADFMRGRVEEAGVSEDPPVSRQPRQITGGPDSEAVRLTSHAVDPIPVIHLDEPVKRLNMVIDSLEKDSLMGGVATALIVGTLFANRQGCVLRIITRNAGPNPLAYENLMRVLGIPAAERVAYYSDADKESNFRLELTEGDVFVATSWWSAVAIRRTVLSKRFFYLIQEVETSFYPAGTDQLLCRRILEDDHIDFIVNSKTLFDYFQTHNPGLADRGIHFEPAFPEGLYGPGGFEAKPKHHLLFYARPHHPRNLFALGVRLLDRAVATGIIDLDEWEIFFVGDDETQVTLGSAYRVINKGRLGWQAYSEFLRTMDLGLVLMMSPHPSYPPFDMACSGGVVVTNRYENRTTFPGSDNVILGDLEEEALLQAIARGIDLAVDTELRKKNFKECSIPRSWETTLEATLNFMGEQSHV